MAAEFHIRYKQKGASGLELIQECGRILLLLQEIFASSAMLASPIFSIEGKEAGDLLLPLSNLIRLAVVGGN
jgi:hypothetical protein